MSVIQRCFQINRVNACALLALILLAGGTNSGIGEDSVAGPKPETVTYGQGDSGTLNGFIYRPAGKGPFPAVLWNHGSEKMPGWQPDLGHFYTRQGYVFFIPHRHGHGRSPGEYIVDLQKGRSEEERVRLHEIYNQDVALAAAWLARQPYVDAQKMAMSGLSYGGIQTLLAAEKGMGMRAFVAFAPGAMSWAANPRLGTRLVTAVRAAQSPVFLLQAQNDYSLSPYEILGAELRKKGGANQARLYPAYGVSHEEGHAGFATKPEGIGRWGGDVTRFLDPLLQAR